MANNKDIMKTLATLFLLLTVTAIAWSAPVQYLSISASYEEGAVLLSWTTISENANLQFIVERSEDNLDWHVLGNHSGQGNSTSLIQYSHVDNSPLPHSSYYRIRQMDFSGAQTLSEVVAVSPQQIWLESVNIFPNPVLNEMNIQLNAQNKVVYVSVMNSLGALVKSFEYNSSFMQQFELNELPKGYYNIRLTCGTGVATKRILKM